MSKPRWLSSDEQAAWRAYVHATKMLHEEMDRQLQRDAGLPFTYYEILVALSEAPDRTLRMSELADFTRSSRSRLSHAVARLEENGWVRREVCETDRRGAMAILTDTGMAVLVDAAPGHVEAVRNLVFDLLSASQLKQFERIHRTIRDNLAAREAAEE